MRIVHFSKYDQVGGASIAAFSSVRAQRDAGANAMLYVGSRRSDADFVMGPHGIERVRSMGNFIMERLPFRLAGHSRFDSRSLGLSGLDAPRIARDLRADIVVLHNVDGLVRIADLPRFQCPIVWRSHDMWAMCGTEHYVENSTPFRREDGAGITTRLSRLIYARKKASYRQVPDLTACPPSNWLRDEMAGSYLFKSRRAAAIPNGIDIEAFRPADRADARRRLSLPPDVPIVLFGSANGAADPRKGFDLLLEALRRAAGDLSGSGTHLVEFGGNAAAAEALGLPVHSLGHIKDRQQLRLVYSAADLVVVPSRLENLSLMVLEALACGTPVVAFAIGGMPDMVEPEKNGWLVQPYRVDQLAAAIETGLAQSRGSEAIRSLCRATVETRFQRKTEASAMLSLYEEIVATSRQPARGAEA